MILGAALAVTAQDSFANPDFTKKTGKKCTYCHIGDWASQKYTDAGLYYKEHSTFAGYVPKPQQAPAEAQPQKASDAPKDKPATQKKK